MRLLFDGGYYSECGYYSSKYGSCVYVLCTVAEKGHQLLLPFGNSAMERCNGSSQWKRTMEARTRSSIAQSHFEFSYRGPSSRPARRVSKPAESG